ncbi:MAG: outer membrane beta-barrel protein [Chitinophagaceae bacterium]|jgi:opacity protein-like surface antigen
MKNQIIFLAALMGFAGTQLNAQSKAEDIFRTYRFGLFIGPTFNSMRPTAGTIENYSVSKTKGNIGFSFGLTADYNINDRYTLFSGIGMDWRGGSISTVHGSTSIKVEYVKSAAVKYKLQYLTVPLGLKMKAAEFDKIKVFATTGVDLGVLLSQGGDATLQPTTQATPLVLEKSKLGGTATVVPVNAGWFIGAGAEYKLNDKNSFYVSLIYRNGFTDVTTPKTNDPYKKFSDGNIRANTFAIRVGYFF